MCILIDSELSGFHCRSIRSPVQPRILYQSADIAYLVRIEVEVCQIGDIGQRRDVAYVVRTKTAVV